MPITIRPERPEDYRDTEVLTREAFCDVYKPGCDEHLIVHKLRKVPAFVSVVHKTDLDANSRAEVPLRRLNNANDKCFETHMSLEQLGWTRFRKRMDYERTAAVSQETRMHPAEYLRKLRMRRLSFSRASSDAK